MHSLYWRAMKVLIVRHAKAEARPLLGFLAKRDRRRPLTPGGRKDMAKTAKGLTRLVPALDALAASPLARARETAEILAKRYDGVELVELPALAPGGSAEQVIGWLREQPKDAVVALVGHEPDLGEFASYLLAGKHGSFLPLKKAGACLVAFDAEPAAAAGRLEWLLPPGALRKLA